VLAAIATFLTLEGVQAVLGGQRVAGLVVYGVLAAFICALVVTDPRRRDRAISLTWSVPALAVAASLAALSEPIRLLPSLVLLVLIFLAFAARRAGLRAGELAVVTTMGTYFASSVGPSLADVPWLAAAAGVGVAWLALWELALLPYDPVRSIRRAARAYAARVATVVSGVAALLAVPDGENTGEPARAGASDAAGRLARELRLAQLTRRVIEAQFPGARAPGGWSSKELTRLQVALYEAELGAGQMMEGCADPGALVSMPTPIRVALATTLGAIAEALGDVLDERRMEVLAERADELRDRVGEAVDEVRNTDAAGQAAPPEWVVAGLRIANGGRRVARAIAAVRALGAIESNRAEPGRGETAAALALAPAGPSTASPDTPGTASAMVPAPVRLGPLSLHLTTALGLQAVLATGLSMALAWLAGVEHPNWVFWTSFVVIAGSLDESLRRMLHRVAGTVAGVLLGVAVATLLPDGLGWVVAGASVAIFLAIYAAPVSHASFVLWLNVAFVLVYASPEGRMVDVLVERPLMTVVGASVAALIVMRVLPIRRSGQYAAALRAFLASVRDAVRQWTEGAGLVTGSAPLAAIDAAYRRVEAFAGTRELAAPFRTGSQSSDTSETEVAALVVAVTRLGSVVELEPAAARRPLPAAVGARIGLNLDATMALAGGTGATLVPTLDDLLGSVRSEGASSGPRAGGSVLAALADVHACVIRLGATLGKHPVAGRRQPPRRP
jgi:hypothetical protein